MRKLDLQEEIKRITSEIAAGAEKKALEVSSIAVAKAAEVADLAKVRAAEVSSMAISKALDASTLAAEKAAAAAAAAAAVATAVNLDLSYIKKDIADTKQDIKSINEKLDNKYVSKEDFKPTKEVVDKIEDRYSTKQELIAHSIANELALKEIKTTLDKLVTLDQFSTVKSIVFGMVAIILTSVIGGLMFLIIK